MAGGAETLGRSTVPAPTDWAGGSLRGAPGVTAPLAGRAVLIARQPDRAADLAARLEDLGAEVVVAPVTTVAAVDGDPDLDDAVRRLVSRTYAWVVVTSVNAVHALTATATRLGLVWPSAQSAAWTPGAAATDGGSEAGGASAGPATGDSMPRTRWAAVGPTTTAALASTGLRSDLAPVTEASADGLVDAFRRLPGPTAGRSAAGGNRTPGHEVPALAAGQSVLLPHGDLADPRLAQGLEALGWTVDAVVAYRTVPQALPGPILARLRAGGFASVVVAAPSAVRSLAEQWGEPQTCPVTTVPLVAIGRSTAAASERLGWPVAATAVEPTVEALAAAVLDACRGSMVGHEHS